jgi:hypothetical protein
MYPINTRIRISYIQAMRDIHAVEERAQCRVRVVCLEDNSNMYIPIPFRQSNQRLR